MQSSFGGEPRDSVARVAESLTRVPLELSFEWMSKVVTTDAPVYVPHDEWSLQLRLVAPVALRAAVVLNRQDEALWGLVAREPETELELSVAFFPDDWATSDSVVISFGWQQIRVTDGTLKADPRAAVEVALPSKARTGDTILVAKLPAHSIEIALLALAVADTERRRMDRWRVRPALAADLPPRLAPLTSGHQHGSLG